MSTLVSLLFLLPRREVTFYSPDRSAGKHGGKISSRTCVRLDFARRGHSYDTDAFA